MAIRSTGIGFASGVGRSGAILAPIVIGTLVGMALPLEQNFIAIAIPAVIALIAVGLVNQAVRPRPCNTEQRESSLQVHAAPPWPAMAPERPRQRRLQSRHRRQAAPQPRPPPAPACRRPRMIASAKAIQA
jgi:hypothetical protein